MATRKSIDGLSPKQRKKSVSSVNADGFTPIQQPRKTTRTHTSSSAKSSINSRNVRSTKTFSDPDLIHPEEFIPPRKTTQKSTLKTPKISNPAPKRPTPTKSRTAKPVRKPANHIEAVNENFLEPIRAFDFDEETGELMTAKDDHEKSPSKTPKNAPKPQKTKKKWSKKRKFWTWFGIILATLLIVGVIVFILWGNDIIARITGGRGNIMDLFSESYEPLKQDQQGRTNILAFGTSGFDMSGTDIDNSIHDGADLTDSIMVISFNQTTGEVFMISLPRDLKVSSSCTGTYKINEVYWCNNIEGNDESAGATALMTEVSDVLGLDLQYYAHLNWGSLESVVNALGGVDVTLDEGIYDYDYTGAVYDPGVSYHLNGIEAVALSRARHGTENGDFSRGASQQKILIGIKDKVISEGLSVSELINLANTLGDNLRTNFSVAEMKSLAHLANTVDFNNIQQISFLEPEPLMTTADIYGISYVIPSAGDGDYSEIQAYVSKMLSSDPRLREEVSILVLNATGQSGIAAAEQAVLKSSGYTDVSVGDAPAGDYTGDYILYSLSDDAPDTLKFLESKYHTTALPASSLPADIPSDESFVLIVNTIPTD